MLTMLRNLLDIEYKALMGFSDGNAAFEARGRVKGVLDVLDVTKQLYDGEENEDSKGRSGSGSGRELRVAGERVIGYDASYNRTVSRR